MCFRSFLSSLIPSFFKDRRKQKLTQGKALTNQQLVHRGYAGQKQKPKSRPCRFVHKTYIDSKAKRRTRKRRRMQKLSRIINRNN